MRYRIKEQVKVNDQELVDKISRNIFSSSRSSRSFIIRFLYAVFAFLTGVASYVVRSFLRVNLGERTFGVITMFSVLGALWLFNVLYFGLPEIIQNLNSMYYLEGNADPHWFRTLLMTATIQDNAQGDIYIFVEFMKKIRDYGFNAIPTDLKILWWLIVLLTVGHYFNLFMRYKKGIKLHSYYRGDSVFFSSIQNKKIFNIKIHSLAIWMILEPALILALGFMLQILDFDMLALVFKISAVSLFLEEYRVFSDNRRMVLDITDSNLDAEYLVHIQESEAERLIKMNADNSPVEKEKKVGRAVIC